MADPKKRLMTLAAVGVFAAAIAGLAAAWLLTPGSVPEGLYDVSDRDIVLGRSEAPVTIVEYYSPGCPHCATFAERIAPALLEGPVKDGTARLVLRPIAFAKPDGIAAGLIHCAPGTDADRKIVSDRLLQSISDWRADTTGQTQAARAGLPADLISCAEGQFEQIALDTQTAFMTYGVTGTPTTFIGNRRIIGADSVETYLDAVAAAAAPK